MLLKYFSFLASASAVLATHARATILLTSRLPVITKHSMINYPSTRVKAYCAKVEEVVEFVYDKLSKDYDIRGKNDIKWKRVSDICTELYDDSVLECDKQSASCGDDWYRLPGLLSNKDENCHFKLIHYCAMAPGVRGKPQNVPSPDNSSRMEIGSCIGKGVTFRKRSLSELPEHDDAIIFDNYIDELVPAEGNLVYKSVKPTTAVYYAALGKNMRSGNYDSMLQCYKGECINFIGCLSINFINLNLGGSMSGGIKNPIVQYPSGLWSPENGNASYKSRVDIHETASNWNQEITLSCRSPGTYLSPVNNKETTRIECAVVVNADPNRNPIPTSSIYRIVLERNGGFEDVTATCTRITETSHTGTTFCIEGFEMFVNIAGFLLSFGNTGSRAYAFLSPAVGPPLNILRSHRGLIRLSDNVIKPLRA